MPESHVPSRRGAVYGERMLHEQVEGFKIWKFGIGA